MIIPSEVIDLLICCAEVDSEKGPKLEALISQGVDWDLVIEQGQRHGILPLLYWSLKTSPFKVEKMSKKNAVQIDLAKIGPDNNLAIILN